MRDSNAGSDGGGEQAAIVLVVEDDVLIRLGAAEALREAGYHVLEAVNSAEALALVESGHLLHVVLTDIRMPGQMDGVALTAEIKRLRPGLPVALISSHLPLGEEHLADRFLSKPYLPSQLIELVAELREPEWQKIHQKPKAS